MFVTGKMRLFLQVPSAFQYLKMGSPISDLLNSGKLGRMGEYVGAKKKIAAIEGGKKYPSSHGLFSLLIPLMTL